MIYRVLISEKANKDLDWFRKNDKSGYLKCFDLSIDILNDPRNGLGKPERLKYFAGEFYRRRINHEDRLVEIIEEEKQIEIYSFKGHYN